MKKFWFLALLALAALPPIACKIPNVPATPLAPTPTPSPVCVYPTPTGAWATPAPPDPSQLTPYSGNTFLLRSQADWQAQFGTTPVPEGLDFSTQMVVGGVFVAQCGIADQLESVCENSTQVTAVVKIPPAGAPCYIVSNVTEYLIVPQSSLPVVWQGYEGP